ncbi:periplasmic binding protein-like I [Fimicolochytrium jonesii]|uniref:periplasmic binding protein-like I n=1 Tax=Fimicolochytrium jonesii TaxID=1396493 RepID=UPI0022FF1766|nr:periplasmic binding protein-like I [Fimicolochytrium jonesii]KAI8816915.1 periplasmic binding protein-like I [Fimicolochytrium jonesii]
MTRITSSPVAIAVAAALWLINMAGNTVAAPTEIKLGLIMPGVNNPDGDVAIARRTAQAAVQYANSLTDLLPNTHINLVLKDSLVTTDKAGAIYAAVEAVNEGVFAVIGPQSSIQAPYAGLITAFHKIPQCVTDAGTADLNNRVEYPNVFRMQVSTRVFGARLIDFVNVMGWKKIAYIYSAAAGGIGTTFGPGIITAVQKHGIEMRVNQGFNGDGQMGDMESCIQSIIASKVKIIVVAAYEDEFTPMWIRARELGLTGPDYVWVTSNGIIDFPYGDWGMSDSVAGILGEDVANNAGVLMEATADPDYTTEIYATFKAQYALVSKAENATRDIGREYIANDRYWDCTMAILWGYHDYFARTGDTAASLVPPPGNIRASPPADLTIFNTNRTGLSGPYYFLPNGDYAYKTIQILPQLYGSKYAATISYPTAVEFVGDTAKVNTTGLLFAGGSTQIPTDFPPLTQLNPAWKSSEGLLFTVLAAILLATNVGSMAAVYTCRNKSVIKRASWKSLVLILVGLLLLDITPFLYTGTLKKWTCVAQPFIFNIGFGLVFANLMAKTWRVYKIFNNPKMMERAISDMYLMGFAGLVVLVEIIISGIWVGVSTPVPTTINVNDLETVQVCVSPNAKVQRTMTVVSIVFNGILLFLTTLLSYKTRHVVSTFNETKWIGISVYNIVAVCALFLPLVYTTTFASFAHLLRCLAVLIGTAVTESCVYGPKFLILLNPIDKPRALQQRAVTANTSSRNMLSTGIGGAGGKVGPTTIGGTKLSTTTTHKEVRKVAGVQLHNVPTLQISGGTSKMLNWNWVARWRTANVTAVTGYLCVDYPPESEGGSSKTEVYRTEHAIVRNNATSLDGTGASSTDNMSTSKLSTVEAAEKGKADPAALTTLRVVTQDGTLEFVLSEAAAKELAACVVGVAAGTKRLISESDAKSRTSRVGNTGRSMGGDVDSD